MNESKEKLRILFCCSSKTKSIVAPSYSSAFPASLIYWEIPAFVCLHKSIPMSFIIF